MSANETLTHEIKLDLLYKNKFLFNCYKKKNYNNSNFISIIKLRKAAGQRYGKHFLCHKTQNNR